VKNLLIAVAIIAGVARAGAVLSDSRSDKAGSAGIKMEQQNAIQYPEPELTYQPSFPIPGDYSVPGACQTIHDDTAIRTTLRDGEKLQDAFIRLHDYSYGQGGIVEIPWDVDTVQCDTLNMTKKYSMPFLTIQGLPGPNGEQARFYCRSSATDGGTIPDREAAPLWIDFARGAGEDNQTVLIENLHIDGYKEQVRMPAFGHLILRNNYLHHATRAVISNGTIGNFNLYDSADTHGRFHLEMCGNEIAHTGTERFSKRISINRAPGGIGDHPDLDVGGAGLYDTWSKVSYVDNLCHSSRWSACFKSTANENLIVGNRFHTRLVTDPSYSTERMPAQTLIELANCSQNTIRNNRLFASKDSEDAGGGALVNIGGESATLRGCDTPVMWHPYKNTLRPPVIDGPAHTEQFWSDLGGEIFFSTRVEDNYFEVTGEDRNSLAGLEATGTYPTYQVRGERCELPTPMTWYERSRINVAGNTWVGFNPGGIYSVSGTGSDRQPCDDYGKSLPPGPGPSDDLVEIGEGEQYLDSAPDAGTQSEPPYSDPDPDQSVDSGNPLSGISVAEEYPELPVVYQPDFPPLGEYSVAGACASIHSAASTKVVLGNRELLVDAFARLKQASGGAGGIIEIPWDVDTVQCDNYIYPVGEDMPLTLRGTVGPNGELPRFYCRTEAAGGTVAKGGPSWLNAWSGGARQTPKRRQVVVENLHIDGYSTWVNVPNAGYFALRNSYLHHATGDGIKGTGVRQGLGPGYGAKLEFCGNEISHAGQGNYKHCLYLASNKEFGFGDQDIYAKFVDNTLHSCNGSSGFKSVTRHNLLVGNRFYNTRNDDPQTPQYESDPLYQMAFNELTVDIAACGEQEIRDNYFYQWRPDPEQSGIAKKVSGGLLIGIRNRRQAFGCNRPHGYAGADTGTPLLDSDFWNPDWWANLDGEKTMKFIISGNWFEAHGYGTGEQVMFDAGTHPNRRKSSLSPYTCLLTPPAQWYERHRTYLSNNTYVGFARGTDKYRVWLPEHADSACGYPVPALDLRDSDLYEVGPNEVDF
jgi:hypothetical protein